MTVVDNTPSFELMARITGWKPIAPARIIAASNAATARDCPLCSAPYDAHSAAWHAYGPKKDVTAAVAAAHDAGLAHVTAEIVKKHFPTHHFEQPAPARRVSEEQMVAMTSALKSKGDRERMILRMVHRQRALLQRQIVDLFFVPTNSNRTSANKSASRTLPKLTYNHHLYRYWPSFGPEACYFLGRYAQPWIDREEGLAGREAYVTRAEQVSEWKMRHDLDAADVFVKLFSQVNELRESGEPVIVDDAPVTLDLPMDAWWGERHLQMTFRNPFTGTDQKLGPDGFAALTVNDSRHQQWRLPFFYEWDSGSKDLEDSAQQMINYIGLGASGALAKRFPVLDAPDWFPPVLMVTTTAGRAHKLCQRVRELGSDRAWKPKMLFIDQRTLANAAFVPGAWRSAHDTTSVSEATLVDHLVDGNRGLIEHAPVHWRRPISIDVDGARSRPPVTGGFMRAGHPPVAA